VGRRSGVVENEDDLVELSLVELDDEIARCKMRLKFAPGNPQRKAFEKRIHWLERFRDKHHGP
jgi:hypothetical protein